jgi:hypothetical protein
VAVYTTRAVTSVVWNGTTYSNATGGPIEFRYRLGGTKMEDRTGDDQWPTVLDLVDLICECQVVLRDVKNVLTLMTKSSLVVTLATKSGTVVLTFANMALVDIDGGQQKSNKGACTLSFAYEAASGSTVPLS